MSRRFLPIFPYVALVLVTLGWFAAPVSAQRRSRGEDGEITAELHRDQQNIIQAQEEATPHNCRCTRAGVGENASFCMILGGICTHMSTHSALGALTTAQRTALATYNCTEVEPPSQFTRQTTPTDAAHVCPNDPYPSLEAAAAILAPPPEVTTPPPPPFESLTPVLGAPIPGLIFSPATADNGTVQVPFLAQYISAIQRYLVGLAVTAAVIMIVYGGFLYLLGSSVGEVGQGKTIITDAIIGLLFVLGAYTILYLFNPNVLELRPLQLHLVTPDTETAGGGGGAHSFCRENLRVERPGVFCATCHDVPCAMHTPPTPDSACLALIGTCGGTFGRFLDGLTEHCLVKRFDWLESLDGGTFGILHYTENNFAGLIRALESKDPPAYARVMAAGHNTSVTNASVCAANRNNGGFVCNPELLSMMRVALREPSFTKVQLADAYHQFTTRMAGGSTHFRSPFGQIMWAIASNNPGSCGASFSGVIAACPVFSGTDENAKIECFLQKFTELGCRGGTASAGRRATAIRSWLRDVSRTPGVSAPPSLATLEACIP